MGRYHVIALMMHLGFTHEYAQDVMDMAENEASVIALYDERMIIVMNNGDGTYTLAIT